MKNNITPPPLEIPNYQDHQPQQVVNVQIQQLDEDTRDDQESPWETKQMALEKKLSGIREEPSNQIWYGVATVISGMCIQAVSFIIV